MTEKKPASNIFRPAAVEDLIYHMKSWNSVKTMYFSRYYDVKQIIEAAFDGFDDDNNYAFSTQSLRNRLLDVLEQYHVSILDLSIKVLNDHYKKKYTELDLTLMGEQTAVTQTILGSAGIDGWIKVSLPVSNRYDTVLSLPKDFDVVMVGRSILLVEGEQEENDSPELLVDGENLDALNTPNPDKEKMYTTNFEPIEMEVLYKNIYKVGEGAKLFFPKRLVDQVSMVGISSVLISLRPLLLKNSNLESEKMGAEIKKSELQEMN